MTWNHRQPWQRGTGRARPRHKPGTMNKSEAAYAQYLESLKRAGAIDSYIFEPFKLRLAAKTFYTPDFLVVTTDGYLELHEVKGHWEDDARVKWKAAADRFWMFRFVALKKIPAKDGGGWMPEVYGGKFDE